MKTQTKPKDKDITVLRGIPGLIIPPDTDYDIIFAEINEFIDKTPEIAKKIEESHTMKNKEAFTAAIESALSLLRGVFARYLISECRILIRRAEYEYPQISFTDIKLFVTSLCALSVEMQKALRFDPKNKTADLSLPNPDNDLADCFAAIERLIGDGQYDTAQQFLAYMDNRAPEPLLANLPYLVENKKYDEVQRLADALRDKYLKIKTDFTRIASPKKILAVDDRPEDLSYINGVLKNYYKMFCVTDGETALMVLESQKPDLFILDIDMPGMDGHELAARIRMHKDHKRTPIICLAGNSSRDYILKAMEVGCNDFVVKPANSELLLEKTRQYLA